MTNTQKGALCVGVTALSFSTMELVSKTITETVSPLGLTLIRFAIGTLMLLPFAIAEMKRKKLRITWKDCLFFLCAGFFGVTLSMSLFQTAILKTSASMVAVIFSMNALFTAPLAVLFLKEKVSWVKWAGLAVSLVGVAFIFNPFRIAPDIGGMLYALGAAVAFSVYTILSRRRIFYFGGMVLSTFSFAGGSLLLLIWILITGTPIIGGLTVASLPQVLWLGLVVTGLGYLAYFTAIRLTSAVTASMAFCIKPALATLLNILILRERLSIAAIIGVTLIILASIAQMAEGKLLKIGKETQSP
ncbi:MAG: DMT family transporter [Eubacteriales bacterium]|jgi:drug/metabolite transporter (DMT)-like permease